MSQDVELAISDAHVGVKDAIHTVLTDATWQRCRVHTIRNILAYVPQRDKSMVVAAIRTIFAQPTQTEAKRQLAEVVTTLRGRWDKAADVLSGAADDVLAYMAFPPGVDAAPQAVGRWGAFLACHSAPRTSQVTTIRKAPYWLDTFGDTVELLALSIAAKERLSMLKKVSFPATDNLILEIVFAADLGQQMLPYSEIYPVQGVHYKACVRRANGI